MEVSTDHLVKWRRERDSNPRYGFPYSGFQDRLFQPLTHPSARWAECLAHLAIVVLIAHLPGACLYWVLVYQGPSSAANAVHGGGQSVQSPRPHVYFATHLHALLDARARLIERARATPKQLPGPPRFRPDERNLSLPRNRINRGRQSQVQALPKFGWMHNSGPR